MQGHLRHCRRGLATVGLPLSLTEMDGKWFPTGGEQGTSK